MAYWKLYTVKEAIHRGGDGLPNKIKLSVKYITTQRQLKTISHKRDLQLSYFRELEIKHKIQVACPTMV